MLTYDMEARGGKSLYQYLYERIRADIESGDIPPQQKLPSKRELAKHLGVSLITVEGAYSQLVAEGYVLAQQRRGYYARNLGFFAAPFAKRGEAAWVKRPEAVSEDGVSADEEHARIIYDFTGAGPVPGLFPYGLWAKTMRQVLSRESEEGLLDASSAQGSLELRRAISSYLKGFRGMDVSPGQIVVGAGAQTLYQLIIQLLGRDRPFAVEDPGYPRLTSIYDANDVPVRHIPLDESGVSMACLRESDAQVLHCMPSHQYPTGLVTSISRRREMLEWAAEVPGRYIIEDDYDCEFRLAGRPIPSLQSIDARECVIYANTFTRSLGASFRFGYMVLPPHLARLFRSKLGFYSNTVSALDQLALAEFMRGGFYERHVNRLRSHYRKVQQAIVESFDPFPQLITESLDSGLHFILSVELGRDAGDPAAFEARVIGSAREQGIAVRSLSGHSRAGSDAQGAAGTQGASGAAGAFARGEGRRGSLPSDAALDPAFDGRVLGGDRARFVIGLTGIPLEQAECAATELAKLIVREIG